jgi:hypothetical protein
MALVGPSLPLTGTRMRMRLRGVQMARKAALAALTASARFKTSVDTPATPKHTIEDPTSSSMA